MEDLSTRELIVQNVFGYLTWPKQQSAGDGGSVIILKHRKVSLLWLKPFLQPPSITSAVEVVIIPGKAENTHSCKYQSLEFIKYSYRLYTGFTLPPSSGCSATLHHLKQSHSHRQIQLCLLILCHVKFCFSSWIYYVTWGIFTEDLGYLNLL